MMVSSGAFSYQQALRTVISEVAEKGATVTYPSGHVDKLDVAIRRSLLTGIGLASRQISEENSRLCGCDLMEISAHSGARPSHSAWQGKIVSLSGRRGYLSKSDIGYGTGAGFGGWNCRHDWYPFYDGISTRNYTQKDLDNLNAKDIEYRGKMYSEYEISQMVRAKERQARALKRERVAIQTAIEEGQEDLTHDLENIREKIKGKSKEIEDFCRETGYKRDKFREQVGGKTSVGHTSKTSQKGLTSKQNSDNIKYKEIQSLDELSRIFSKEEKEFLNSISDKQKSLISDYTGVDAEFINSFLRGEDLYGDIEQEDIDLIDDAISKFNLVEDIETFRAIPSYAVKDLKVGDVYQDFGYMSTTPLLSRCVQFAQDRQMSVILKINLKKGTNKGAYINSLSEFKDDEYEFLLKRGSKFKVESITETNGLKIMELVEYE